MTYTEEFPGGEPNQEVPESSGYPTMFGITFTPLIGGVIVAVLGLAGAIYLVMNMVMPALDKNKELQNKLDTTQSQIDQKKSNSNKIQLAQKKLDEAKQKKIDVLALFPNERTLDTLLLDINRFTNARNGQLESFVPDIPQQQNVNPYIPTVANVVNDNSLGLNLNNKLKRQTIKVILEGDFDQTVSIVRSIERLQQLLLIKDLQAELDKSGQKIEVDEQGKIVPKVKRTKIKTTFKLQALIPLTPEEAAIIASQPKK